MEIIKLEHITKRFQRKVLFRDVSLTVETGAVVGFRGENGCGKSVLLKIISGLYRPDSGEVFARGKRIGEDLDFPPDMGVFIDAPGFIPLYSGYKNLKFLADIQGKIGDGDIRRAMELVGLDSTDRTPVKSYSLGMKQKLGIAQAIMEGQDILLLDEPFNALDQDSHARMISLVRDLRSSGRTVLLTSHNAGDLEALCDRIYHIASGGIQPAS